MFPSVANSLIIVVQVRQILPTEVQVMQIPIILSKCGKSSLKFTSFATPLIIIHVLQLFPKIIQLLRISLNVVQGGNIYP